MVSEVGKTFPTTTCTELSFIVLSANLDLGTELMTAFTQADRASTLLQLCALLLHRNPDSGDHGTVKWRRLQQYTTWDSIYLKSSVFKSSQQFSRRLRSQQPSTLQRAMVRSSQIQYRWHIVLLCAHGWNGCHRLRYFFKEHSICWSGYSFRISDQIYL